MNPDLMASIRSRFRYDARTGDIIGAKGPVGSTCRNGYVYVTFGMRKILAHRLAWLIHHGEWPAQQIDHINMVRTDNRIENLRLASPCQNGQNASLKLSNSSGYPGVYFNCVAGRYFAQIRVNGKRQWLGAFDDAKDAGMAYAEAKRRLHPFANGRIPAVSITY